MFNFKLHNNIFFKFDQVSWTTLSKTTVSVKAAAEASFMGFTGGAKTSTEVQKTVSFKNARH